MNMGESPPLQVEFNIAEDAAPGNYSIACRFMYGTEKHTYKRKGYGHKCEFFVGTVGTVAYNSRCDRRPCRGDCFTYQVGFIG